MSWVTVAWAAAIAACLVLALQNMWVWLQERTARHHLLVSAAMLGTAGVGVCEFVLMRAHTLERAAAALLWVHVPVGITVLALIAFVRFHLRAGRPWLFWAVIGTRVLASLVVNFLVPGGVIYTEVIRITPISFLGESISTVDGILNPWNVLGRLGTAFLVAFFVDAAVTLWRRGQRRTAVLSTGAMLVFAVVGIVHPALIQNGVIRTPYFMTFGLLGVAAAMSYDLSSSIVRARSLATRLLASEAEARENLRFETLLAELSTRFVNLPAGETDREIESALRSVSQLLEVDLALLWQWSYDGPVVVRATHVYARDGLAAPAEMRQEYFPWFIGLLLEGRTVTLASIEDMPPEAAVDREVLRAVGVKSNLTIPLLVGGEPPVGALGFNALRSERDWPAPLVQRLHLFAQVFTHALARKRQDLALRQGEERLRVAADSAGAGMWSLNLETGTFWASTRGRSLFGYGPEEDVNIENFLGEAVHPGDRDLVRDALETCVRTKEPLNVEYRTNPDRGPVRWISSRGEPRLGPSGEPDRVTGASIDVTDRKATEMKAQRQRDELARSLRFETAVSHLSLRLLEVRPAEVDREIEDALGRVCEIFDFDAAVLWQWSPAPSPLILPTHLHSRFGKPLSLQMREEDYPWAAQLVRANRAFLISSLDDYPPEAAVDAETCRAQGIKSGGCIPLSVGGEPPIGAIGFNDVLEPRARSQAVIQKLQLVGQIFTNALARKRHDLVLRESEERLNVAAESAGAGLWALDLKTRIFWASEQCFVFFGFSPDEIVSLDRFIEELVHPADRDLVRTAIERSASTGEPLSVEYRTNPARGPVRWISSHGRTQSTPDGEPERLTGASIDVTDRRLGEAEAQLQREELAHLSRVTMVGELSGSLAHELNQPLTAILSNTQAAQRLLACPDPDLEEVREILADVVAEDKRAGEVIRRLRILLRKGEVVLAPLDLVEVVQDVLKITRSDVVNKGVMVTMRAGDRVPAVSGDRVQLQQVLLNLVINACDAMTDGTAPGDRKLTVRVDRADGGVEVSVADRGHGIAAERVAHIFEPFFTTKAQGIGLGLAVCHTIIQAHGGRIWAENNAGAPGATFRFTLPFSAAHA